MSDSLRPHELHNARLLCLSPSPGVSSNLCPLSQWHHPTISSSVPSSPPAFNLSQHQGLFQRVSSSHSATVLPMNIQGWFPLELIDWFDLLVVQGTLKSSPEQYFKSLNLQHLAFFKVQLTSPHGNQFHHFMANRRGKSGSSGVTQTALNYPSNDTQQHRQTIANQRNSAEPWRPGFLLDHVG